MEKINLIVEKTREELTDKLSFLNDNGTPNYKITRIDSETYTELSVTPTDVSIFFITGTAISIIQEVYESSEWRSNMFYGISMRYDKIIKKDIPSLSIYIRKKDLLVNPTKQDIIG